MKSTLLSTAIGGVLALGVLSLSAHAADDPNTKEFIKLPKGTCERIVGGSLTST